MNAGNGMGARGLGGMAWSLVGWAACLGLVMVAAGPAMAQRPSTDRHVRELARYLDGVKIAEPVVYRNLAVYPILVDDVARLHGSWLTLDSAIARGVLVVMEKGGGSVPILTVENRSRDDYVFIMTGEVIAGGKQTRTARHDVILGPGRRIDLDVFCVEAHRWSDGGKFESAKSMLPQSIQGKVRGGASQADVWSEVARNNKALNAENATGSLDEALKSRPVREKLEEVRRRIVPDIPRDTLGFIFVDRGRAVGADFFGRAELARELLPKLLDSYAVDYVLLREPIRDRDVRSDNRVAIDFFERVCRTGSDRANTPGSGQGIRTQEGGLLGDGVSFDDTLVHYGVQVGGRVVPQPKPRPPIIWPRDGRE
jgi:hypothetical protein